MATPDTIPYNGREWRESQIWELCKEFQRSRGGAEILTWKSGFAVKVWTQLALHRGSAECPGPSPWPALRAAVEALNLESEGKA